MKATRFEPMNWRDLNRPELDHGRAHAQLDGGERGERRGAAGEQSDDLGRGPAPGVAFDQREDDRGEAGGQGDDAGVVDPAARPSRRGTRARRRASRRSAPAATGRLMKKIACQPTCSVRKPPTTGPIESARAETPAQVPIALPRSCGGEGVGDDREGRRHHQRGADALDGAARRSASRSSTASPAVAEVSGEDDDADQEHRAGARRCRRGARRSRSGRRR